MTGVLSQVVKALEDSSIAYVLVGSMASSARGIPRTTNDADIVAAIRTEQVDQLVARLQGAFYIDRDAVRRAVAHHRSVYAIHYGTGFKVDLFVPPPGGFGWQQLARRVAENLDAEGSVRVFVATAEDIVIAKLDWYRSSGQSSDRQWLDLVGIIKVQGDQLDRQYLRDWASRLGLAGLLARAFEEAGPDIDSAG